MHPLLVGFLRKVLPYVIGLFVGPFVLLKFLSNPVAFMRIRNRDQLAKKLQDPKYGKHGFIESQGVRLHYVEKGDPQKPLMLFLHGFPQFWYKWHQQLQAFSGQYHCVALDMRGYNDSEKPTGIASYRRDVLVEDIRQVILKLQHDRAVVVGHDWGGIVACNFAVAHPDLVTKLILANTAYSPAFARLITKPAQFKKSWYVFMFQLPWLPELLLRSNDGEMLSKTLFKTMKPEDAELHKYAFLRDGCATASLNYYRAVMQLMPDALDGPIPKITVPTLLIWGEHDLALTKAVAESFRKHCDSVKIIYCPDNSHWLVQEDPELFNKHARAFLEERA